MTDTGTMSDADTTHTTADGDQDAHGHAPTGELLGPVDWEAWAYALGGGVLGLLVALALLIARGG
jgi:hypothetical protein